MMTYLVLETEAAAAAREQELSAATGYPYPPTETDRVVKYITHKDGRGALPIPAEVWSWTHRGPIDLITLLTDVERDALYSKEDLRLQGWFDFEEMP